MLWRLKREHIVIALKTGETSMVAGCDEAGFTYLRI